MNFSNVPTEPIAQKNLDVNNTWFNFISDTINLLKQNLSDEGYVFPALITDDINSLNTMDGNTQKIIYNKTTQKMMVNNTGSFLNITTSIPMLNSEIDTADLSKLNHSLIITETALYLVLNGVKRKIILSGDL